MATRTVCSSTSTSTISTSKLYSSTRTSTKYASDAISTTNCRRLKFLQSVIMKTYRLWLLRYVLGIPSVQTMIENRRLKFNGNLLNGDILLYFSVMTFRLICALSVFLFLCFLSPPQKKKMTMAQLRHLEIGIDATAQRQRQPFFLLVNTTNFFLDKSVEEKWWFRSFPRT